METELQHENNITTISVKGSVDALTAAELTDLMNTQVEDGHANLVIDLTGLAFMSSAGLRSLLGAVKETRSHGGDLRIVSTNPGIDKVLKMSGFHNIAKVFTTQADAAASFG
jgi:anti-sigma B factor antagonist